MISQTVVEILALIILVTAVLVAGRFLWCLATALRARRYLISIAALIGFNGNVAAAGTVFMVWFGYAVAHIEKDAGSDLKIVLFTVPPFFLVSIGLWLLGGKLQSRLRSSFPPKPSQGNGDTTGES